MQSILQSHLNNQTARLARGEVTAHVWAAVVHAFTFKGAYLITALQLQPSNGKQSGRRTRTILAERIMDDQQLRIVLVA
jgi:hypothetical protein